MIISHGQFDDKHFKYSNAPWNGRRTLRPKMSIDGEGRPLLDKMSGDLSNRISNRVSNELKEHEKSTERYMFNINAIKQLVNEQVDIIFHSLTHKDEKRRLLPS